MSKEFVIGEKVRVIALPPYVKTADPMPMLRPPEVIQLGEEGVVIGRRPAEYWVVRFAKGAFLIDSQYIEAALAKLNEVIASETDQPSFAHLEHTPSIEQNQSGN